LPRLLKIRTVKEQFNISDQHATELIDALEKNAEASPLTSLQPSDSSQFILSSMGPNYEMALFIAQVTGSVIVTDSETRWSELQQAQYRNQGIASHPWNRIYNVLDAIPMDYQMVEMFTKSQGYIAQYRTMLRSADKLILDNTKDEIRINQLTAKASGIAGERSTNSYVSAELRVLAPDGGLIDSNVQRLLVRSGCLNYDPHVRSVYFVKVA
jgi:hypothetical protein